MDKIKFNRAYKCKKSHKYLDWNSLENNYVYLNSGILDVYRAITQKPNQALYEVLFELLNRGKEHLVSNQKFIFHTKYFLTRDVYVSVSVQTNQTLNKYVLFAYLALSRRRKSIKIDDVIDKAIVENLLHKKPRKSRHANKSRTYSAKCSKS